jgi:hypothetical protein
LYRIRDTGLGDILNIVRMDLRNEQALHRNIVGGIAVHSNHGVGSALSKPVRELMPIWAKWDRFLSNDGIHTHGPTIHMHTAICNHVVHCSGSLGLGSSGGRLIS